MYLTSDYPIHNSVKLTVEGFERMRQRVLSLRTKQLELSDLIRSISTQQSTGPSMEESSWQNAMDRLNSTEVEIDSLTAVLSKAKIIERATETSTIALGSSIRLLHNNKQLICQLVGSLEADPSEGKISDQSPLGLQLLGKTAGSTLSIKSGKHQHDYKIVDVS